MKSTHLQEPKYLLKYFQKFLIWFRPQSQSNKKTYRKLIFQNFWPKILHLKINKIYETPYEEYCFKNPIYVIILSHSDRIKCHTRDCG